MRAGRATRAMFPSGAALVLVAFVAVAFVAPAVGAAPDDGPPLVTGSKPGPVSIGGGRGVPDTLVGKLTVGAGKWVAWAKLQVSTENPASTMDNTVVSCRLVSGTNSSKVSATLGFAGAADFLRHGMELSLARNQRNGGQFRLYCRTGNGHAGTEARQIRLDAVQVDQLVRVDLDDGTTTIVGSGDVRARVGAADNPVTLGGANARGKTIVADLSVHAGNWWIRAELAVHAPKSADIACSMSLAGRVDHARIHVRGALSAVMDLTAHVSRSDPHSLKLKCGTDVEQGAAPAVVDQVRVTAFRVNRLIEHNLETEPISRSERARHRFAPPSTTLRQCRIRLLSGRQSPRRP